MKTITSSKARQEFSAVITAVENEPVTISRKNRDVAVVVSSARYKELKRLEDILYGKAAEQAIKEGLSPKYETDKLLDDL